MSNSLTSHATHQTLNKVHKGGTYPSRIELPIVPERKNPKGPNFLAPQPVEYMGSLGDKIIEPSYWKVTRDMRKRSAAVEWGIATKSEPEPGTTLEVKRRVTASVPSAERPGEVILDGVTRLVLSKPGGVYESVGAAYIRSDEHAFHLYASLDISYEERPYHRKEWKKSFPRRFR